ncbi:signal peptide peptidase SppA [Sphingomonas aracearum]|uniref:Signal peptide peptidase SppA n=1 Tax=Sphingomonas aracearum TaxID=2283317 RepID=A0A369VUF4_9SPHN|nr:signal peptide peptidase SppA [Sphingomonas aracearum]RDE06006.1 signal peptide peptidase SppA [Sphingomonas aracearum]
MKLVRGAWKLLVGIKDLLVLAAMLLFFGLLFAALSRPSAATIRNGALLLKLDGRIVEQPTETAPFAALSGRGEVREVRLRDLLRVLDKARSDDRVKAVVLDLSSFGSGYPAALNEVAEAIGRVRKSGKPVLSYAAAYTDGGYRLAANASEIWESPIGGTIFMGPGGSQLYYKGLIDKLGVNAHVYRVGKYKSFVEPYTRADASPEAKEDLSHLYGVLLDHWRQAVTAARPKAQVAQLLAQPAQVVTAAAGDLARSNLQMGIVDKLGDRLAFDRRVAEIAGTDPKKPAGGFNTIAFDAYVDANPAPSAGDAVGVLTIAGDIVDGRAPAGTAGGDTIAKALLDGLAKKKLKALVVRVDSPGGSVPASETIRSAILEAKRQNLPIVVSMGGIAASGGYWVSTPADLIFAEPTTVTGSIGIFGVIPTFENALRKIGVTSDGVRTTPLSGQPDLYGGTTPETDAILQASIENGYRQFLGHVSQARRMPVARVNEIAQGRVWDGGTARQIGLVDRFGTLDDAIAEAARRARLTSWHAEYLEKQPGWLAQLARTFSSSDEEEGEASAAGGDLFGRLAADRRALLARALGDARRLATGAPIQARCLACEGIGGAPQPGAEDRTLLHLLLARLSW